jgi:hypothetical protein
MPLTLSLNNYSSNNLLERARLTAEANAGATSITLDNTQGFTANDYVLIGAIPSATAAIYQISAVTGGNLTLPPLAIDYPENTIVYRLFGNKIKIYTAPDVDGSVPAIGTFSVLKSEGVDVAPITIDPDQLETIYTDQEGNSDKWYRFTYYNSTLNVETPLADSDAVRDTRTSEYCTLEDIRIEAGLQSNVNILESTINQFRQSAQEQIDGALQELYEVPFTSPTNPLIADITKKIAAGNLLMSLATGQIVREQAKAKIEAGEAELDKINKRDTILSANVTPLGGSDSDGGTNNPGGFNGWPNSSTENASPEHGAAARKIRASDEF